MAKPKSIVIGAILLFLLVSAGFAAGTYFKYKYNEAAPVQNAGPIVNEKTYIVSPASIGAALITLDIPVQFKAGLANVILSADKAAFVKKGQNVLLLDAGYNKLNALAEVVTVQETPGGSNKPVAIVIAIKLNDDYPETIFKTAQIGIKRETSAKRLPLSAILHDKEGRSFVWEAARERNGSLTAKYREINIIQMFDGAAVFSPFLDETSNLYITAPDDNLETGQILSVREILYSGPKYTPDITIVQQIDKIAQGKLRKIAAEAKYATPGGQTKSDYLASPRLDLPSGQTITLACGASLGETRIFIDTIAKSALEKPKLKSNKALLPAPYFPPLTVAPKSPNKADDLAP